MDPAAAVRPPIANAGELGQAVSSADRRFHLVSFLTTPLLLESRNDYVVFDTATAEADKDHAYLWRISDEDGKVVETGSESVGVFTWSPEDLGDFVVQVTVRVEGADAAVLSMRQTVVDVVGGDLDDASRLELDALAAEGAGGPAGGDRAAITGDVDTTTELLLELSLYLGDAALATQADLVSGQRNRGVPAPFLAAVVYDSILSQPKAWSICRFWMLGPRLRSTELEWAAEEVNAPESIQITRQIEDALGVAKIRMDTAAMVLGGIGWRDQNKDPAKRKADRDAIWESFKAAFGDPTQPTGPSAQDKAAYERRVDLFNLIRFPKTNLIIAAKLLARLKNRRFPALDQQQFLANERARQIVATEYQIGSIEVPAGTDPAAAEPNEYGRRVAGLATRPFIATWFKTEDHAAPLYGDLDLARAGPNPAAEVTALQQDLRDLGFRLAVDERTGAAGGRFDNGTELAVREFQIHSKFDFAAYDRTRRPAATPYMDWLRSTVNFGRYGGPVCGVVNHETRRRIRLWKTMRWRCPVVIDARDVAGNPLQVGGNNVGSNIWSFDYTPNAGGPWRAHVRDLSRYYPVVDGRDPLVRSRLGWRGSYGGFVGPASLVGAPAGWTIGTSEVWRPSSEVLPEHLLGPGKTLDALSADERATYKVVRAVAEIECNGYFDSMNAYDGAFMSLGTCHWTIALLLNGALDEGELVAYLAYLRHVDREAFDRAIAPFGTRPEERWGGPNDPTACGQPFFKSQRKYAGWLKWQDAAGDWVDMPRATAAQGEEAANWFRNWHWYYRFAMAGRAVEGFRRRMWDMARVRLRDILSTPWGTTGANDVPNLSSGAPATIGDVFTSEKAAAFLLRAHVLSPATVIRATGNAGVVQQRASDRLRQILANAALPAPLGPPDQWPAGHEGLLLSSFRTWFGALPANNEMRRTLTLVDQFPIWEDLTVPPPRPNLRNLWGFRLAPAAPGVVDAPGDALVGPLHLTRNSFKDHFDRSGLPTAPDYTQPH